MIDWTRNALRQPASRREFHKSLELISREVPTIRPLGFGECRWLGVVSESFLITEAIPDTLSLADFVANHLPRMEHDEQSLVRAQLAEALAV